MKSVVLSTPMFELISVTVFSPSGHDDGNPCRIFGSISADNEFSRFFHLYVREEENPEIVDMKNPSLLLSGPKPIVVSPSALLTVYVGLEDSAHGIVIADGRFSIDYRNGFYTQEGVKRVEGENGAYALLKYATFPFAVTARVEVLYFSKDCVARVHHIPDHVSDSDYHDNSDYDTDDDCNGDNGSNIAHVSGTVIAKFKNQFSKNINKDESCFSITVLNKPPGKSMKVKSGSSLKLDRSVFAVPSYSRLKIYVNLTDPDTGLTTSGFAEFKPHDMLEYKKDIAGENGRIRVRVHWNHGYDFVDSSFTSKRYLLEKSESHYPLIEVFSVGVFSNDRPFCSVHGKIYIHDGKQFAIFDKDETSPQACSRFETLGSMVSPSRCLSALDEFAIFSDDLTDENGGIISSGHVSWRMEHLALLKIFDKQICSLIRGKTGFAAVHYSVFQDGIQCHVKVLLYERDSVKSSSLTKVRGKLMAQYGRYGMYLYSTSYEQQYYRSTLFEGEAVLEGGSCSLPNTIVSTVPLSKGIVSAPRYASLVIKVDLTASADVADDPLSKSVGSRLKGTLVFDENDSQPEKKISMGKYRLSVLVRWKHDFM